MLFRLVDGVVVACATERNESIECVETFFEEINPVSLGNGRSACNLNIVGSSAYSDIDGSLDIRVALCEDGNRNVVALINGNGIAGSGEDAVSVHGVSALLEGILNSGFLCAGGSNLEELFEVDFLSDGDEDVLSGNEVYGNALDSGSFLFVDVNILNLGTAMV